jgi:hypothetical protein
VTSPRARHRDTLTVVPGFEHSRDAQIRDVDLNTCPNTKNGYVSFASPPMEPTPRVYTRHTFLTRTPLHQTLLATPGPPDQRKDLPRHNERPRGEGVDGGDGVGRKR